MILSTKQNLSQLLGCNITARISRTYIITMDFFKDIKRASFKHKNNKITYYIKNYFRLYSSLFSSPQKIEQFHHALKDMDKEYILKRVNYYNKLEQNKELPQTAVKLSDFVLDKYQKSYFFDTNEYTRFFRKDFKICPLFGDITYVPEYASLTKSRPIEGENSNSVLFKLNKIRHFIFIKDKNSFLDKKNMLVGRTKAHNQRRVDFLNTFINHPLCDVGQVNRDKNHHLIKNRLTIEEHLKYKFILCLEGNDVASNLKWVMSSNSIAVMPKPKFETWFMEGTLTPNHHYILIKNDFSDLEERLQYYIDHTDEALQIIDNAHCYVDQFKDKKREDIISMLVLEKYFLRTNQINQAVNS